MGQPAKTLGILLGTAMALSLSACTTQTPPPTPAESLPPTHTPVVAASSSEPSPTDSGVCSDFQLAVDEYDASLSKGTKSSIPDFIDAYTALSFAVDELARASEPGTDVRVALLALSSQAAESADALIATGGLTTTQKLDMLSAFRDAVDVCGLDVHVDGS